MNYGLTSNHSRRKLNKGGWGLSFMRESHKRSVTKAVVWRVLATTTTILIVYFFTGEPALSLGIGFVEIISKMILYYFHERSWNNIKWGKY